MNNSDLLRPSLAHAAPPRSPYSQQAHFLSAFFGGPLAALAMTSIDAVRLRRVGRDMPWIAAATVAYLGFEWWLARTLTGRDVLAQADGWLGRPAIEYVARALALLLFAAAAAMHRREHKAADVLALPRPKPWLPALGLIVVCPFAARLLRNLLQ